MKNTISVSCKIITLAVAAVLIFMMTGCSTTGLTAVNNDGGEKAEALAAVEEETTTEPVEPDPPEKIVHQTAKQGNYYIRNIDSEYVYFSAPLVYARNVTVPEDPEQVTAAAPEADEIKTVPGAAGEDTAPSIEETGLADDPSADNAVADEIPDTDAVPAGDNTEPTLAQEPEDAAVKADDTDGETTAATVVNYRMKVSAEAASVAAEDSELPATEIAAEGTEAPVGDPAAEETAEIENASDALAEQPVDNRMINNLQMEVLGKDLPCFELRFDEEGYGYFTMKGTDRVLGFEGSLKNGANVLLQDMERSIYPGYENWPDPLYKLADHQRWIVNKLEDGTYVICSAVNPEYVMTVDDRYGIHFANLMMWRYDERGQQKFIFEYKTPRVETTLEEGSYFIRTALSSWMMVSIGDYNFDSGRSIYMYHSDGQDGQVFTISYDEYGLATITHSDSNMALSIENGDAINDQRISQYESDGGDWQKWILEKSDDSDGYIIRSARNVSEVMHLTGGVPAELQPVCTYWNNGSNSQRWYFSTEAPQGYFSYSEMLAYAQNYSSATDYLILVNSITNHVGIYSGYQGNWTCIQYWDCVTGSYATPTVKGEFTVVGRVPSFDGDTDAPAEYTCYYATMFYPAYFFHSIVYYKGTMNIMDATMGWNASHGCVRLYIENAQWIYENIPDGTKVISF